jgi:hypothetical protein
MSTAHRVALAGASNPSNTPETRKMANVKYVKKRPRDQEQPDAPPVRDRAGRTRPSQRATAPDTEPEPTFSSSKPAAFPSLSANAPPSPSPPAVMTFSGHGMVELMDAMETNDDGRVGSIKRHFDHEYEAGTSPWYADLRSRWDPNTQDSPVRPVRFFKLILDTDSYPESPHRPVFCTSVDETLRIPLDCLSAPSYI